MYSVCKVYFSPISAQYLKVKQEARRPCNTAGPFFESQRAYKSTQSQSTPDNQGSRLNQSFGTCQKKSNWSQI